MTSYDEIFDRFEQKIEDPDKLVMSDEDWRMMLNGWLDSAIGFMELDDLIINHDLSLRDGEAQSFNDDLDNNEKEVLALYMVVAWYEPKVNSLEHVNMFYGSKDEKWTNQKDHLKAISDIQEKYRKRARKYVRNHSSRNNSYLNGEV